MIDIIINGSKYKMILNENLFSCINVLFMGFMFYENIRYKKYISANNICYLVRG